jgi:hypothetical protein
MSSLSSTLGGRFGIRTQGSRMIIRRPNFLYGPTIYCETGSSLIKGVESSDKFILRLGFPDSVAMMLQKLSSSGKPQVLLLDETVYRKPCLRNNSSIVYCGVQKIVGGFGLDGLVTPLSVGDPVTKGGGGRRYTRKGQLSGNTAS